jgi:kynurenine formamidase
VELPLEISLTSHTRSTNRPSIGWTEKGLNLKETGWRHRKRVLLLGNCLPAEHGGTHIDAPIHFFESRNTSDAIPLRQLIGRGALIDVSLKCAKDSNYQVVVDDLIQWERKHKARLDDVIVVLRTGFEPLAQPGEVSGN